MNPGNIGDGVDGAPNGISVPRWSLSPTHLKGSRPGKPGTERCPLFMSAGVAPMASTDFPRSRAVTV